MDKFFESRQWISIKSAMYAIFSKECMKCKKTKVILNIDHVKPRHKYPSLELDIYNCQILCRECNLEKFTDTADYRDEDDINCIVDYVLLNKWITRLRFNPIKKKKKKKKPLWKQSYTNERHSVFRLTRKY